jgi:hypothetical protein
MILIGALAVIIADILFELIRREIDPRFTAVAIWVAVAFLLASTPALRTYSSHGMWHASMVNVIHVAGAPPENPLFAGDLLYYPYAFHWLVAKAMHVVPLAPIYWFQLLNLAALAAFLWLILRISKVMGASSGEQVTALILSLFSLNPFANVALRASAIGADSRSIPFNKFSTINTTQLGFVVLAAILLLCVQCLRGRSDRTARFGIPLLCCVEGFLYPMLWPVALVFAGALVVVVPKWRRNWGYLLSIVVSVFVVLPFFISISMDKSPDASMAVRLTVLNALEVARFLVLPCVCLLLGRSLGWVPRDNSVAMFLLLCVAGSLGGYLLVDGPDGVQYKLLAASAIPMGLFVAGPIHRMSARPLLVIPIIAALLFHSVSIYTSRSQGKLPQEPVIFSGKLILPGSKAEQALTTWIRDASEANAVFMDTTRSIPVHGMRSLFAAVDLPVGMDEYKGWTYRPSRLVLIVSGTDRDKYFNRIALTDAVFGGTADASTMKRVAAELPGRPLYVVSRDPMQRRRLSANSGLTFEQSFGRLALYKLKEGG